MALDGGNINIFYNTISERGTFNVLGGSGGQADGFTAWYYYPGQPIQGGNGGNGSVSCGSIATGTYQEVIE